MEDIPAGLDIALAGNWALREMAETHFCTIREKPMLRCTSVLGASAQVFMQC